jgi:D-amino-acid dehydrogenase
MHALGPLGHASRQLFDDLVSREAIDCAYRPDGYYDVFLTEPRLRAAVAEADLMRGEGYQPEVLDGAAMREREPALKSDVVGGVFYPEAASINPYSFVTGLADRAARAGATVASRAEVKEVLTHDRAARGVLTTEGETITADAVVLATGAYSADLCRRLGLELPLQPAKGYHRDRDPREGETPRLQVTCMLGEKSVFCTPMDGYLRFAGTLEFSGLNHEIRQSRLEQLTRAAAMYLDGVGEAESRSEWCGLRPCIADGLPVIGSVPRQQGVFVATGHAMLGLTLGPVTGMLVADCVLDGRPSLDIAALGADRF